ncbi:hypothetical protein [Streptomyces sp. NPDC046631]|jgi:hypothetical protein|uniref:hypothetical protein n=1 Tax=unclassified Streptomyces TaxID=2593676 RepID=UPI0033FFEE2F
MTRCRCAASAPETVGTTMRGTIRSTRRAAGPSLSSTVPGRDCGRLTHCPTPHRPRPADRKTDPMKQRVRAILLTTLLMMRIRLGGEPAW